jgi:hypothetical protein
VVNPAIVRRDVVLVEKKALLYCTFLLVIPPRTNSFYHLRLLKLVTGVDISTRAVNKSGRPGNAVNSKRRTAAAAPNTATFLLSMLKVDMVSKGVQLNSI